MSVVGYPPVIITPFVLFIQTKGWNTNQKLQFRHWNVTVTLADPLQQLQAITIYIKI